MNEYPSHETALSIALKTFDWLLQRAESKDRTLTALATWITTVTVAFVPFASTQMRASIKNPILILSVLCFASAIKTAYDALTLPTVRVIDPMKIYNNCLYKEPSQFNTEMVYMAGTCFNHNNSTIDAKAKSIQKIVVWFSLEALFLILWVMCS